MTPYLIQALSGLSHAATLFLVACGLSIIFGVTRIVNFAHGSFYMLGAFVGKLDLNGERGVMADWHYADGKDYMPPDAVVRKRRPAEAMK